MKKRVIKKIAIGIILILMVPLLAGCHGRLESREAEGAGSTAIPETFDDSKPVELVFWAKNDTNKVQTAVYTKAIEDFEQMYPNVKINLRLYADYSRIFADVITNIATKTTPNICITYPDHIATYKTGQDVVLPLDDWMKDSRFGLGGSEVRFDSPKQEEVVPEFLNECILDGRYYAVPYMRSTEALYVNQDMVEQLGYELPEIVTWDFVWEVSEKAMEKNEDGTFRINGQKVMIPFIYKSTDNMMITMLKQLDAPYSTEDGEVLIFNDTTKGLLEEVYKHAKSRAFSTFAISSYPGNFLNAGQCIFAIDSTAGATWMGSEAPMLDIHEEQVVPFKIKVMPIPQFKPEEPKMISQGPDICIFNKEDPQEVLASWLFTQYLLSNKVQLGYAETEGYVPVTLKAQESAEYQDYVSRIGEDDDHYSVKIQASELLRKYTSDTFVTPVFNGSTSLRSAAGQLIESTSKSARRKEKMNDAYIEKLYSDVTSLFQLDQIEVKAGKRVTFGELPAEAKTLLIVIPCIWILIGLYALVTKRKGRKKT